MQCVILAGGLATRMRPLTENCPKALLPAGDHPFIHYQLAWLARHGVDEVILCLGYQGALIRDYVGSGSAWGLRVSYTDEGKELRGTAGALRLCFDQNLLADTFFLTYGDSFLPIDFSEVWRAFRDSLRTHTTDLGMMTVLKNGGRWDKSNSSYQDGRVLLYDKHGKTSSSTPLEYIDYGLSVLKRPVVQERIPAGQKADLADVFHQLSLAGQLAGFEVTRRFYEIGSPSGLEDFRTLMREENLFK